MSEQPISPLVANIISANAAQLAGTTNYLIDTLTEERDEAAAELAAVRAVVSALLNGDVQPSARAIERALYPSPHVIARFRRPVTS